MSAGAATAAGARLQVDRILLATDFTSKTETAAAFAAAIARRHRAEVYLVHILDPLIGGQASNGSASPANHEAIYDEFERIETSSTMSGISLHCRLACGEIATRIGEVTAAEKVDLIVLGMGTRDAPAPAAPGPFVQAVLRSARCPVLTVRAKLAEPAGGYAQFREILLADDLSAAERMEPVSGEFAAILASEHRSALTVLHVLPFQAGAHAEAREFCSPLLQALQARLPARPGHEAARSFELRFGSPAAEILRLAEERYADLIVIGRRVSCDQPARLLQTGLEVVAGAQCPVLTIPLDR